MSVKIIKSGSNCATFKDKAVGIFWHYTECNLTSVAKTCFLFQHFCQELEANVSHLVSAADKEPS